jgi:hypothetical protein
MNPIQPRQILMAVGTVAGACAIAVPAALGLSGNPSFSQRIPVGVPSTAQQVSFDDHTTTRELIDRRTTGRNDDRRHAEPGDDRSRHAEPGDDRGRDDHGGSRNRGHGSDDRGGDDHGDDHGGRHGSDDQGGR